MTRRIRDYDTGEISYVGSGFFTNIVSKLTGKLASKAAEKLIEKGAEKVGEKNGEAIGKKIIISFLRKSQFKQMKQKEKKLSNF